MGTPSDGKTYPEDVCCRRCGDILIGDEVQNGICDGCDEKETDE